MNSMVYFVSWLAGLDTGIGVVTTPHTICPVYLYPRDIQTLAEKIETNQLFPIQRKVVEDSFLNISNDSEGITIWTYPSPKSKKGRRNIDSYIEQFKHQYKMNIRVVENTEPNQLDYENVWAIDPVLQSHSLGSLKVLKDYTINHLSNLSPSKGNVERLRNSSSEARAWLKVYRNGNHFGDLNLHMVEEV